jgi:EAL domain-containing protein (putative c-di-GMP-specific phosphodiesterase class I)
MSRNDFFPTVPVSPRLGAAEQALGRRAARTSIRGQASEIIAKVLADTSPERSSARQLLSSRLASHPGSPEEALLEHLMAIRSSAGGARQHEWVAPSLRPRPQKPNPAEVVSFSGSRSRIKGILHDRMLLTAFQPVHCLKTAKVIGAEALSRFVSDDGASADYWFGEAAAVGLGFDLEFYAMESALMAAEELPSHLHVSLNVSPALCLDPRLTGLLENSGLALERIVLELTGPPADDEYDLLAEALEPLRLRGVRLAMDDAGTGFASLRPFLELKPDIIKLVRDLTAGIDQDCNLQDLAAALVEFGQQTSAVVAAEGIETAAELDAVQALGVAAGQGYFLGRPSIQPEEWAAWHPAEISSAAHSSTD